MVHDAESCRQMAEMLSAYLDLELPPDACAEVEQHIAGCAPCVDFVESLRRTIALCCEIKSLRLGMSHAFMAGYDNRPFVPRAPWFNMNPAKCPAILLRGPAAISNRLGDACSPCAIDAAPA